MNTPLTTITNFVLQILMSVQSLKRMTVAPTPCVPTRKDHMSVAVNGDMLEMVKTAQVKYLSAVDHHFLIDLSFQKKPLIALLWRKVGVPRLSKGMN